MLLEACAYSEKGICFCLAAWHVVQFARGLCETHTRACLVQVSNERGSCLVDEPANCGLFL